MLYRDFGKTGLKVSAVGFGCGRVGGLLLTGSAQDKRAAVRKALAGGVNWFDTAEAYGTEAALGELLADASEPHHVSTKVTLDPAAADLAGQVEERASACLKRLRREAITLLQVHNRIDDAGGGGALTVAQMLGPVAEGFARMKARGAARFAGFTALGDTASILRVIEGGAYDSAQVYYNIVNPSAAGAMPPAWRGQSFTGVIDAAKKRGMGLLGIRVLDGGIIATDDRAKPVSMMARETSEEIEARKAARALAALHGEFGGALGDRAQIGLRFALSNPDLSLALVGIGAPGHVDAALAAVEMGPLPAAALARIDALLASNFA